MVVVCPVSSEGQGLSNIQTSYGCVTQLPSAPKEYTIVAHNGFTFKDQLTSQPRGSNTPTMPTAVITGANSGVGHAWAKLLISEVNTIHHHPTIQQQLNKHA